ncbi:MAG: DNA-protecting protein DprA [Candidatus Coatesbacteria bacterium]|nr:DNA-protecting protein DprA [Candidatus Coatesbacteria bacterium]
MLGVHGIGGAVAKTIIAKREQAQEQATEDIKRLARYPDTGVILYPDPDYPPPLKDLYDPPMVLYCRGGWVEDDRRAVAVVGTRRTTAYGASMAAKLGKDLAEAGFTVVSGCAAGIDLAAQRSALKAGGRVIGVLGNGVDRVFPAAARDAYEAIAKSGALISEFPLGVEPRAENFPRRNRIIAALALATVVVEAPEKSGALITARYAAELGREVLACPGNALAQSNRGSHALLKDGAGFCETYQDVLEAIGATEQGELPLGGDAPTPVLVGDEETVHGLLTHEPLHLDELSTRAALERGALLQVLLGLEFKGLVEQLPGMYYRRPF